VIRFIARVLFHLRIIGYASLSIRKLTDTYNPIRAETAQAVSAFPLRWRQAHIATSANVKPRRFLWKPNLASVIVVLHLEVPFRGAVLLLDQNGDHLQFQICRGAGNELCLENPRKCIT